MTHRRSSDTCRTLRVLLGLALCSIAVPGLAATPHKPRPKKAAMTNLTAHQITLVDETGQPKLRLSATSGTPTMELLGKSGEVALTVALDATGHPAITMNNPDGGSTASLAVDPKGAHVKFDRPGGASSYLFLNDEGVSGVVLLDRTGQRRYEVLVNADGTVTTKTSQADDKPVP